jgi:hypothetical protein
LFGFLHTADLGQQYDMVSRVGGNFSIYRHKTFFSEPHLAWYALFSQVALPWFIPHRGILWYAGPHPKFISGSLLRGVITRAVLSSNCYGFLGALAFETRLVAPLATFFVLSEKSAISSTTAPALAAPLKGSTP